MAKYSFIIPVYNVEKWLKDCVESVLSQTYMDYEIILVDDGSTDKSGTICDDYSEKHQNITVIHQKNAGLSMARNVGVLNSASEYIIFLDSDDFWTDNTALERINCLTSPQVDIIVFSSVNYYENSGKTVNDRYDYPEILNTLSSEECIDYMIKHDLFNVSACKRVFKRSFFVTNDLFFKPGIKSEDIEQGIRTANCLPIYKFLNSKFYVYRHRESSISTTVGEKHIEDYLNTIETYANFMGYYNDHIQTVLLSYLGYQYALLLAYFTSTRMKNRQGTLKKLKSFSYLLSYPGYPRTEKINKAYKILGFNLTRFMLAVYLKMK